MHLNMRGAKSTVMPAASALDLLIAWRRRLAFISAYTASAQNGTWVHLCGATAVRLSRLMGGSESLCGKKTAPKGGAVSDTSK